MKVFVTGGNGFIGSRVVHRLHADGHSVRCLLRATSRTDRIDGVPWERHLGDLRELEGLRKGMEGCDAVIHLASISSWDAIRSPLMREVVVDGTRNVLSAAAETGLRTVFVSSVTAIGATREPVVLDENASFDLPEEPFVYAHAKRDAEELCMQAAIEGLPVLIVNPCEVWGPNDDDFITAEYARDTLKDWPAMTVNGGTALAHVDDIAGGIVSAIQAGRPGERYILGGENVAAPELTRMILEAGGKLRPLLLDHQQLAQRGERLLVVGILVEQILVGRRRPLGVDEDVFVQLSKTTEGGPRDVRIRRLLRARPQHDLEALEVVLAEVDLLERVERFGVPRLELQDPSVVGDRSISVPEASALQRAEGPMQGDARLGGGLGEPAQGLGHRLRGALPIRDLVRRRVE